MKISVNIISRGFLELSETRFSLTKTNTLYTFGEITTARSTQLSIPRTRHNEQLLTNVGIPAFVNTVARQDLAVQMVIDGAVFSGVLLITSVEENVYQCVITFGELLKLRAAVAAGNVSDYFVPTDETAFDYNAKQANLEPTEYATWEQVAYRNGFERLNPYVPGESNVDFPTVKPLPSIDLYALISRCCQRFGLQFIASDEHIRIVPPSIKAAANQTVHLSNADNTTSVVGMSDAVMTTTWLQIARQPFPDTWRLAGFEMLTDASLTFDSNTPTDLRAIRYRELTLQEYILDEPLAGKTIELKRGDVISFVTAGAIVDGVVTVPTRDYNLGVQVASAENVTEYGRSISLRSNLPNVTIIELIRWYAAMTGGLIMFADNAVQIVKMPYTIDSDAVDLSERIISTSDLRYTFKDFARRNTISFDDEGGSVVYQVYNETLDAEKELMQVAINRGEVVANSEPRTFGDKLEATIKDSELDDDGKIKYLGNGWSAFRCGETYCGQPIGMPRNQYIDQLCSVSISRKVNVRMTAYEYARLSDTAVYYLQGLYYICYESQWSANIATLHLSRVF